MVDAELVCRYLSSRELHRVLAQLVIEECVVVIEVFLLAVRLEHWKVVVVYLAQHRRCVGSDMIVYGIESGRSEHSKHLVVVLTRIQVQMHLGTGGSWTNTCTTS